MLDCNCTAAVAQLVVAPDCGSGCRGFKSHQPPQPLNPETTRFPLPSLFGAGNALVKFKLPGGTSIRIYRRHLNTCPRTRSGNADTNAQFTARAVRLDNCTGGRLFEL